MKRLIFLCCLVPELAHAALTTNLANGELCMNNANCASGVCLRNDGLSLARCAPRAKAGEECSSTISSTGMVYQPLCEAGLLCVVPPSANDNFGFCVEAQGECPSNYIMVNKPYITLATHCPSGTTTIGTAVSCLVSNNAGDCIMYIPAGDPYTDDAGTYEYTEPCAL